MRILLNLVLCHLVGDYVLQNDFIAASKGNNLYHLFVHCMLYILPFYLIFPDLTLVFILFATHFVIDILKAKYKKIDYVTDQCLHYIILIILYL